MNPRNLEVILLYRDLIKVAKQFKDYNLRMYCLRKTRDEFRSNKDIDQLISTNQKEL